MNLVTLLKLKLFEVDVLEFTQKYFDLNQTTELVELLKKNNENELLSKFL
jgi:hypothetical protein